jgi:hypothetical protein
LGEGRVSVRAFASTLSVTVLELASSSATIKSGGGMKKAELTLPEIALIAGTRGVLGAGLGLLLADRLNDDQRKAVGWAVFLIGAISTIPLVANVFCKRR